jgi:hypothetical protein
MQARFGRKMGVWSGFRLSYQEQALATVNESDARAWFRHSGYALN